MNRKIALLTLSVAMFLLALAAVSAFVGGNSHRAAICIIAFWLCFAAFAAIAPITRQQARKM